MTFLRKMGHTRMRSRGGNCRPTLTAERLLGASPQVFVGWFDSDEEHVPLDVFAGGGGAPAGERLIQQYEVGHFIDFRQKPVGKRTTAGAGNLPTQQLD